MGSKKAKKQTVGFQYFVSMHLGLTHGPVDFISKIMFGDKVAWSTGAAYDRNNDSAGLVQAVHQEGLFGGLETGGEGGVSGTLELGFGGATQQLTGVRYDGTYDPAALAEYGVRADDYPQYACNYRGMAVVLLHGWYWGTNPYLKNVSVNASRYPGPPVNVDTGGVNLTRIGNDANPAFIILDCALNSEWGMGYPSESIDILSVFNTAERLYYEGFGMSLILQSQQTVEDFINEVCEHIDATWYFLPSSGLWRLNLIRPDDPVRYSFDQGNCRLVSFARRLLGETVNQVTVKYTDPETEEYISVGVQDDANIEAQGQPVPGTKEYRGIRRSSLALQVAQRDLRLGSACLATAEIVSNRYAWPAVPGDTVTLSHKRLKIKDLRMRISEVKHAEAGSGKITLSLVEDVFGQMDNPFSGGSDRPVVEPPRPPGEYDDTVFWEVPYWFVLNNAAVSGASADEVNAIDPLNSWVSFLVRTGNSDLRSSVLIHRVDLPSGPVYENVASGQQTPSAVLGAPMELGPYSPMQILNNRVSAENYVQQDSFVVIGTGPGQEIARIVSVRSGTGLYPSVQRGLMDTHPKLWPAGTRIWFVNADNVLDDPNPRPQQAAQTYKVLMYTSTGYTPEENVTPIGILPQGRQGRPYPAGNVTIGGLYWPTTVKALGTPGSTSINVRWATRNRKLQDGNAQVDWSSGSIAPEANTLYSIFLLKGNTSEEVARWMGVHPGAGGVNLPLGSWTGDTVLVVRATRNDSVPLENFQDFRHEFTITAP